jgi:lysozyme
MVLLAGSRGGGGVRALECEGPDEVPFSVTNMYGLDLVTTPTITADWLRVRESGRTFAYVRAAYGATGDAGFPATWTAMRDAGIVRGAWQVLRHDEDPVDQAVHFLKTVELQRGDLPPMLDLERMATSSPGFVLRMLKIWFEIVESELEARHGFAPKPIIRTSSRAWPVRQACTFQPHALWIVDPSRFDAPTMPRCWEANDWTIHQYAIGTRGVPGIPAPVQLDRFHPIVFGDRGRRVELVKTLLREAKLGFGLHATPEFDEPTLRAITHFQESRGLLADGIVGPKTFAQLHWR